MDSAKIRSAKIILVFYTPIPITKFMSILFLVTGGGLGGKKESGQLRFGGRERPFRAPL